MPKRFRPIRRLGEGGMGVVWEAVDTIRDERVAVKTMRATTPDSFARFKREFRSVQEVRHPNLVALGDLVGDGERWCFSMELVSGVDFLSYVRPTEKGPGARTPSTLRGNEHRVIAYDPTILAHRATLVPVAGELSLPKLLDATRQLVSALDALHRVGVVHRDVKPSNAIVTGAGRLVLLDFGVALDLRASSRTHDGGMQGTPAYMAPEQTNDAKVGPAADWYALGTMLFEALTGCLPFEGELLSMLAAKHRDEAPRVRTRAPTVPVELDELCARLLERDPDRRPASSQLLEWLQRLEPTGVASSGNTPAANAESIAAGGITSAADDSFVGREKELLLLHEEYEKVRRASAPRMAVLCGESGVGKSALMRRFVDQALAADPGLVALSGRCYVREDVPFRALDGVVDALARYLRRLPASVARELAPTRPAPLLRLFPVLRRVECFARLAAEPTATATEPLELRRRAVEALRDLFARVCARQSVVISIDNVQWADADSFGLLHDLLRGPDAPPLLLVTTLRTAQTDFTRQLRATELAGDELVRKLQLPTEWIEVPTLTSDEAETLAARLIGNQAAGPLARKVAEEAGGHPLFIDALIRYTSESHTQSGRTPRFEEALRWRIEQARPVERNVMELLAVAGTPLRQEVLRAALSVDRAEAARALDVLTGSQLATISGSRANDLVDIYHDRLRGAVYALLGPDARKAIHQRLALALETTESRDFEALASHWERAGRPDRAAGHLLQAADQALAGLAFSRAARLYQRIVAAGAAAEIPASELHSRLGDALANAGKAVAAAEAYRVAARTAEPGRALTLESRVAEQLVRAGAVERGLQAMRAVLARVDIEVPATTRRAVLSIVWLSIWLWLRGVKVRPRPAAEVTPTDLQRFDTVWTASMCVSLVDTTLGAALALRGLRLALSAGSAGRAARASALVGVHRTALGGPSAKSGWRMIEYAAHARERLGVYDRAMVDSMRAIALYCDGDYRKALDVAEGIERTFAEECVGTAFEIGSARLYQLRSRWMLGALRDTGRQREPVLRDAIDRGDIYMCVSLAVGFAALPLLAQGQPDRLLSEMNEALGRWSKRGGDLERFDALIAETAVALYQGRSVAMAAKLADQVRSFEASQLTRLQIVRLELALLEARTLIAAAREERPLQHTRLARAARLIARVRRERAPWASAQAQLLDAERLAVLDGNGSERVISAGREAIGRLDAVGMGLYAHAARWGLATQVGGEEAESLRQAARTYAETESIREPERFLATWAPALGVR